MIKKTYEKKIKTLYPNVEDINCLKKTKPEKKVLESFLEWGREFFEIVPKKKLKKKVRQNLLWNIGKK